MEQLTAIEKPIVLCGFCGAQEIKIGTRTECPNCEEIAMESFKVMLMVQKIKKQ